MYSTASSTEAGGGSNLGGVTDYCTVEWNKTRDVAAPSSRRDHRKSKFGLRHAIKLNEPYCMTKSEFWFSIAWLRTRSRNVPNLDPGRVNCQTLAGAPRVRDVWNFFRKFTKSRARPPRGCDASVPYQSSIQYSCVHRWSRRSIGPVNLYCILEIIVFFCSIYSPCKLCRTTRSKLCVICAKIKNQTKRVYKIMSIKYWKCKSNPCKANKNGSNPPRSGYFINSQPSH
jgi:hypothetical protein